MITVLTQKIRWAAVYGLIMSLLVLLSGCSWLRNAFYRGQSPPQIFNQQVSKEQIIQAVNSNSQAIRSMQAKVHVRATGTPTLSGDLSVEQPSRLRMQVGLLNMTNSGIDLGSNDNEFWVWIKSALPGQPPAVLYANHAEYERSSVKQALPIEPSWVIDSLGLAYFDPRLQHAGPFQRPDGSLEIRTNFQSSIGPMMKSTIVDPQTSVVIGQELYRNGTKIAASRASKHQYFEEINASIPRQVEIEVGLNSQQPGNVTIELSSILPNSIDSTYAGIWVMPRPRNIQMIDIVKQTPALPGGQAPANQPQMMQSQRGQPSPQNNPLQNFGGPLSGTQQAPGNSTNGVVNSNPYLQPNGATGRPPNQPINRQFDQRFDSNQPNQRGQAAGYTAPEMNRDYYPRGFRNN